jgi:hypothetical protein
MGCQRREEKEEKFHIQETQLTPGCINENSPRYLVKMWKDQEKNIKENSKTLVE